ncbi:carboxy terminal-processing peptidase [Ferruginibacter sp. SUN106]|uniref:carboxy terminal-processing peptidase n=1 Tax=Ferruginibacter sp. SUN106 TaxID=2978348 RepID=UPI003D361860
MKKICTLLFLLLPTLIFSQTDFRAKTLTLRRFLEQQHYKPLQWNDTSSTMLYNKWMKELDEEKLFFTQKEITVLETYKTNLDEEIMGKTTIAKGKDFFSQSTSLYKLRLQKADSIIKALTVKPFDFTKPDNITWPFTTYAVSEQDIALRWLRYLKWRVLNQVAEKVSDSTGTDTKLPVNFAKLESDAREKIKQRELAYVNNLLSTPADFTHDLEDEYLNSIAWCYDPHTSYMNLKEKKEFDTELSGTEYSAGLDLEEDEKGDKSISYLQPGGSAWRSGQLHKGDIVIAIKADGKEKNVADISDEELSSYLNGNSESDVAITVKTSAGETKTAILHKEKVDADEGIVKSYVLHGKQNIGYINLPGFYSREDEAIKDENDIKYDGCANDVSKEIVKLKKDTIGGLILDLRFNGGGSMWEAMQLAGIFIDIGPVASVKDKTAKVQFLKDPNRGTIYDGPLIVLVNGASASASEFVSAVLQDYNRALIVGGTTYGKGTAQQVLPLDTIKPDERKKYEDYVKVTLEKFYRVNGSTTQWKGVVPDIALPDMYSDDEYKEKSNASALQPDNSKAGMYQALPVLPVATLAAKSKQRIDASNYFKKISSFISWMQQYKKERNISLQWSGYAAQYTTAIKMYKQFSSEEKSNTGIVVTNNGFDWQRIAQSAQRSKEINDTYLKHLQTDETLAEAYRILMDWNGK